MKYVMLFVPILLVGCNFESYRYACQNPENWKKEECQKPVCEVSRTCPEHVFENQNGVLKELEKIKGDTK
jgi:hypothetical protein